MTGQPLYWSSENRQWQLITVTEELYDEAYINSAEILIWNWIFIISCILFFCVIIWFGLTGSFLHSFDQFFPVWIWNWSYIQLNSQEDFINLPIILIYNPRYSKLFTSNISVLRTQFHQLINDITEVFFGNVYWCSWKQMCVT